VNIIGCTALPEDFNSWNNAFRVNANVEMVFESLDKFELYIIQI
jgi:hypothetical protein